MSIEENSKRKQTQLEFCSPDAQGRKLKNVILSVVSKANEVEESSSINHKHYEKENADSSTPLRSAQNDRKK